MTTSTRTGQQQQHAESSSTASTFVVAAPGEVTPLLVTQTSDDDALLITKTTPTTTTAAAASAATTPTTGQASVLQTILNLAKTCMGTGCLALPFVCRQGGIVVFVVGTFGIAAWNVYSVERLCRCLNYMPREETSRRARRRHRLAAKQRQVMMITTAATTTIPTPSSSSSPPPPEKQTSSLSSFYSDSNMNDDDDNDNDNNDNDNFSWVSEPKERNDLPPPPPSGTTTLGVVTWFAFGKVGLQALDVMLLILFMGIIISYLVATTSFLGDTPMSLGASWDTFLAAMFMCLLSLVPDMGYLSRMSATGLTVLIVAFLVIALHGILANNNNKDDSSSFPDDAVDDDDDDEQTRLLLWPASGVVGLSQWFGVAVFGYGVVPLAYNFRESMAEPQKMVGATTIALAGVALLYIVIGVGLYLLYPGVAGEILHELGDGFVPVLTRLAMVLVVIFTTPLLILPCSELVEGKLDLHPDHDVVSTPLVLVRLGIVTVAGFIAVLLPGFVQVLSFVGCACVGLVGFCLPPILHMRLLLRIRNDAMPYRTKKNLLLVDGLMIAWGVFATIVSSVYTFSKLLE